MPKKKKDILILVLAVVFVAVVAVMFLSGDISSIEDTNGAEDTSLTTITDENIIALDMGALNAASVSVSEADLAGFTFSSFVKISSNNFSGVHEVLYNYYVLPSDFVLDLSGFTVDGGNFKMVVVHDDQIVATLEPGETVNYCLEDVTGRVSLRIAGESADYTFYMTETQYNNFEHN